MSQYQDLQAKLRLLCDSGLVPAIDSHSKLAQELGIRRQNVNKWINGADGVFAWRFDDHSYTSPAEAEKQLYDAFGEYLGLQTQGQ